MEKKRGVKRGRDGASQERGSRWILLSAGDHSLICPSTPLRTDTVNGLPASFRRAEGWGIVTAIPLFFSVGVLAAAIGIECEFHFGDVNETIPVPNDMLADVVV